MRNEGHFPEIEDLGKNFTCRTVGGSRRKSHKVDESLIDYVKHGSCMSVKQPRIIGDYRHVKLYTQMPPGRP